MSATVVIVGNVNSISKPFTTKANNIGAFVTVQTSKKNEDGTWANVNFKFAVYGQQYEFVAKWFSPGKAIVVTGKIETIDVFQTDDGRILPSIVLGFDTRVDFVSRDKDFKSSANAAYVSDDNGNEEIDF